MTDLCFLLYVCFPYYAHFFSTQRVLSYTFFPVHGFFYTHFLFYKQRSFLHTLFISTHSALLFLHTLFFFYKHCSFLQAMFFLMHFVHFYTHCSFLHTGHPYAHRCSYTQHSFLHTLFFLHTFFLPTHIFLFYLRLSIFKHSPNV